MRMLRLCTLIVLLGVAARGAAAQSGPPPAWAFSVTPYGWFAGLSGKVQTPLDRFPGRSFNADFDSIVGDLSTIPIMGMAEARYGRFGVVGDVLYLGLEQGLNTRDVAFQGGHARVNTTIGSLLGLFRVLDLLDQSLDVGAGVRIWNADTKLSLNPCRLPGVIQKDSVTWSDPLLAARYHLDLTDRFGLSVYGDIGGFNAGSVLTWQAMGSVDYSLTPTTVLRAGWRYLTFDKKRNDVRFDLGFNGPFIAATFRF
ncbi:hypothetical protein ACFQS7_25475 [Dankookia sp. GCM10030260]|uniref:hypothetical protein n=1 Tax=Dankookia sp. GCM10030260 TaxID=3273390 RepID=UPI0036221B07